MYVYIEPGMHINGIWCKIYIEWFYNIIEICWCHKDIHKFSLNLIIPKFSYNIGGVTFPSPCRPGYFDTFLVTTIQQALLWASPSPWSRLWSLGGALLQHPVLSVRGGPVQGLSTYLLLIVWSLSSEECMQKHKTKLAYHGVLHNMSTLLL